MLDELKAKLLDQWWNCCLTSYEYLLGVPVDQLAERPFHPRFETFAREFADLIYARYCYLEAFRTGILSFEQRAVVPDRNRLEHASKASLLKTLRESDQFVEQAIRSFSLADQIGYCMWLFQHERLHHGKLILYYAKLWLPFPPVLMDTWGRQNFIGGTIAALPHQRTQERTHG